MMSGDDTINKKQKKKKQKDPRHKSQRFSDPPLRLARAMQYGSLLFPFSFVPAYTD